MKDTTREASHAHGCSGPISEGARMCFNTLADYAFDEAIAYPSQLTIARDMGVCRQSVNRWIRELREAGWIRLVEQRWGQRWYGGRRWKHNVYELLGPYTVSALAAKRITRKAHGRESFAAPLRISVAEPGQQSPPRNKPCRCWACKPPPREKPDARAPRPEPRTPLQAHYLGLYKYEVASGTRPSEAVAYVREIRRDAKAAVARQLAQ